jgi:LysR family glycine cleavage system transcriptional activator
LLTPLLWKGDVAAGRLQALFPDRISTRGWAYWLVFPSERRMVPKVKRFREWLLSEMEDALAQLGRSGTIHLGEIPEGLRAAS